MGNEFFPSTLMSPRQLALWRTKPQRTAATAKHHRRARALMTDTLKLFEPLNLTVPAVNPFGQPVSDDP